MTEIEPHEEFVNQTAGYVGAHEAVVGADTDPTSLNVAHVRSVMGEAAEQSDEEFVPATHLAGGDVLDTTLSEEESALRERAEREDPILAANDAAKADLEGRS